MNRLAYSVVPVFSTRFRRVYVHFGSTLSRELKDLNCSRGISQRFEQLTSISTRYAFGSVDKRSLGSKMAKKRAVRYPTQQTYLSKFQMTSSSAFGAALAYARAKRKSRLSSGVRRGFSLISRGRFNRSAITGFRGLIDCSRCLSARRFDMG